MPSTVNSVTPFRPIRWFLIGAFCAVIAYFIGYGQGQSAGVQPVRPSNLPTISVQTTAP